MKVLITAGPTYEPIDPVRFIGNRSSGKQGIAIAKVFANHNYNIDLIAGPINEYLLETLPRENINIVKVNTALEMYEQSLKCLPTCDIAIHTAAVADFRPEQIYNEKIKKGKDDNLNNIKFIENPDILATFGKSEKRPKLVIGFSAETSNIIDNAKIKLANKNCDFIIANDVSNGKVFNKDTNEVFIISKNNIIKTKEMKKELIAEKILEIVEQALSS